MPNLVNSQPVYSFSPVPSVPAEMAAATKPTQIRIRIVDEDVTVLDQLAGKAQSRTEVASVLLNAAVEAIKKNKGRVHYWPPKLTVDER